MLTEKINKAIFKINKYIEARPTRADLDLTGRWSTYADKGMTNKKMDQAVYQLRRNVMNYIYEAKNLLNGNMPRVEVRITENDADEVVAGVSLKGGQHQIIWIPEEYAFKKDDLQLKFIVFHELVHTVFNEGHDKSNYLMGPVIPKNIDNKKIDQSFLKYAEKNGYI